MAFGLRFSRSDSGTRARTSSADSAARARSARSRQASRRSVRICALTAGIAGRLTLSSSTPRPTGSARRADRWRCRRRRRRSRPAACAPSHGVRDEPEHRRVQAVDLRRELRVPAVHRERVLREVVGADGEEVRLARELRRHHGGRRHFHHDAGRASAATPRRAASSASIAFDVAQFAERRDHREHDADLAERRRRAGSRAAACAGSPGDRARRGCRARRGTDCPPSESAGRRAACRRRRRACG